MDQRDFIHGSAIELLHSFEKQKGNPNAGVRRYLDRKLELAFFHLGLRSSRCLKWGPQK